MNGRHNQMKIEKTMLFCTQADFEELSENGLETKLIDSKEWLTLYEANGKSLVQSFVEDEPDETDRFANGVVDLLETLAGPIRHRVCVWGGDVHFPLTMES